LEIQKLNQLYIGPLLAKVLISFGIMILFFLVVTVFGSGTFAIENAKSILSDNTYDSINPEISVSGDDIYTSWISNVRFNNSEVMFSQFSNESMLPTNIINVSNTPGISNIIKLKSSKNNVYITWEERQYDKWELLFRNSKDGGKTFSNLQNLSSNSGNVYLHDVSTPGSDVFVVWAANENVMSTNKDVFFKRSIDFGDSFDKTINLSNNPDDSLDPHMITNRNGSIIYVVWTECDIKHDDPVCNILFTKSMNQGVTFTDPVNVSIVKIISDNNSTFKNVLKQSAADRNLNGSSSNTSFNSTVDEATSSINPHIVCTPDGAQIYVIWEQTNAANGNSEIFLTSSKDFGTSFSSEFNISNTPGISRLAYFQLEGNDLYLTWSDTINQGRTFDVMLMKIDGKGNTNYVRNLSNNSGNSVSPNLLAIDGKIFVTWIEITKNPSIILWSGKTMSSHGMKERLNSQLETDYMNPHIFEAKNKLLLTWTQYAMGKHEIVLLSKQIT
jgi:hypothetical protein